LVLMYCGCSFEWVLTLVCCCCRRRSWPASKLQN
jgi:hypothetical protein